MTEPEGGRDRAPGLARIAVLVFVAALPFPHNAAWQNVALFGMLVSAIWLFRQRRQVMDLSSGGGAAKEPHPRCRHRHPDIRRFTQHLEVELWACR